ncbi:hypothetical protein ACIBI9_04075 [Nonomuraea sp. NPDC050451]|uniref:hypothetical protein n=1 Tax=Nonomuraea sp. NPDC050451 TaxID=3364364 RepID=UPI0037920D2B
MALERTRRIGPYAPLSATYYYDDALALAGEPAELLFVRGLAFSAQVMNDGFISDIQLTRQVGVGMADVEERAAKLVEHGLWDRVDGGYVVRAWLKWNKSAEEVGRYRAKDSARKAKGSESDGRSDSDRSSARNPRGIPAESDRNPTHRSTTQHNTASAPPAADAADDVPHDAGDEAVLIALVPPQPAPPEPGSDDDPDWARFWSTYPNKRSKKEARVKWARAIKAGADPELIIAGAEQYSAQVRRERRPKERVKHPDGWLSGERWNDFLEPDDADNGPLNTWDEYEETFPEEFGR